MDIVKRPEAKYTKYVIENIEYKMGVSREMIDFFLKSFTETKIEDITLDSLFKRCEELSIVLRGAEQVLDGAISTLNQFDTYLEQHSV